MGSWGASVCLADQLVRAGFVALQARHRRCPLASKAYQHGSHLVLGGESRPAVSRRGRGTPKPNTRCHRFR